MEYLKKNSRVKTVKLRGVISQGILMPLDDDINWLGYKIGDGVDDLFGFIKYEPLQSGDGFGNLQQSKQNPHFIKYTKIENIKNYPDVLRDDDYVFVTEKIHGTNFRIGWVLPKQEKIWDKIYRILFKTPRYEFCVGSFNAQLNPEASNLYTGTARKFKKILSKTPKYIFFGEIHGAHIQKNARYGTNIPQVLFFDIYDTEAMEYLGFDSFTYLCDRLNLDRAPDIYQGHWDMFGNKTPSGQSYLDQDTILEGFVIRTRYESWNENLGRVILKDISTEYLLQKNNTDFH